MNCYLLVGGRSRRMGESKTELFLARVVEAARPVFDEVIAVQRRGGESCEGVRTIFEEAHTDEGPVFGVVRALQDARGKCVILAVDYPLVRAEVLRFLAERTRTSDALLVVPEWNEMPQTLFAGYDTRILPLIEERLHRGALDLRGLIGEARAEMIRETELRALFAGEPLMNVNTPEERNEAEALYGR